MRAQVVDMLERIETLNGLSERDREEESCVLYMKVLGRLRCQCSEVDIIVLECVKDRLALCRADTK